MTFEEIRLDHAHLTQNKKNEIFINSFLSDVLFSDEYYLKEYAGYIQKQHIITTPADTPILEFLQQQFPNKILSEGQAKAFLSHQSKRGTMIKTDPAELALMFLHRVDFPKGYTLIFGQSETPANTYFFFIKSEVIGELKLQDLKKNNL